MIRGGRPTLIGHKPRALIFKSDDGRECVQQLLLLAVIKQQHSCAGIDQFKLPGKEDEASPEAGQRIALKASLGMGKLQ